MGDRARGLTSRTAYARAYYRDTALRRRKLRRDRNQRQRWIPWLLANLVWTPELVAIVPRSLPIRRALLRLPVKP